MGAQAWFYRAILPVTAFGIPMHLQPHPNRFPLRVLNCIRPHENHTGSFAQGQLMRQGEKRLCAGNQEQCFEAGSTQMYRYLIIIEATATGYSAYSPDLPGCVATGRTREEVEREMHDALEFHVEGLRLAGEPIPEPRTQASYCEVAA